MIRCHFHIMFQGELADALALWGEAFPDMTVTRQDGGEGPVMVADVELAGQHISVFDSPPVHAFTFTPSVSLMIRCDLAEDVDRIAGILGADGDVLMPLGAYDFSDRYTWINDRFGVSWQIMLAP